MLKTNKLREFLTHLHEQVKNHSIYVWGAQGQLGDTITEAWIRSRETNETNAKRAIAFWRKQVEAGFGDVLRAFDCSGLGMYWLQNVKGILRYDLSAHGLYNKCEKLTKDRLRVGDFVFKVNKDGKATHIGYVADTDLNVIEARGRDAGVVQLPLSGNTWNAFGRPPFWTEAEVAECEGRFIHPRSQVGLRRRRRLRAQEAPRKERLRRAEREEQKLLRQHPFQGQSLSEGEGTRRRRQSGTQDDRRARRLLYG